MEKKYIKIEFFVFFFQYKSSENSTFLDVSRTLEMELYTMIINETDRRRRPLVDE